MFIIGKANDEEIKEMESIGFRVDAFVDESHFNLALDPNLDIDQSNEDEDKDDNEDKLVSIFIDCDIVQQCRLINAEV